MLDYDVKAWLEDLSTIADCDLSRSLVDKNNEVCRLQYDTIQYNEVLLAFFSSRDVFYVICFQIFMVLFFTPRALRS